MEELRSEKIALQEQLSAVRGRVKELEEQIANESICSSGFEPVANHEDLVKIVSSFYFLREKIGLGRLSIRMRNLREEKSTQDKFFP